jgi:phage protein D
MSESPLSALALYSAQPTVRINGTEQERVTGLLVAIEMTEREDGLSTLELKLDNVASDGGGQSDFAFEDEASFKLGDSITVYCGEERAPTEIFRGIISALEADFSEEGTPSLTALAEDTLQKARIKRRTRTYDNQSLADIARSIAGDLGLTPQISGFTQAIGTQVQLNESDLAFLRRLLARYDGDLQVVGSELHVSPRADVRRGSVELALHSQLRRVTVLADLAHQVSEVTVTGWDPARGQRITSRSSGFHQGPGSGRWGSDLLSSALGRRTHQIGHLAVTTDDEGRALADATFDERQRRFVTARGTAEGNPAIRAGTHVRLTGLSPRFSNTYYVTHCCHRFDRERGYETDFTAESAFFGQP